MNLFSFSKFTNALVRKGEKTLIKQSIRKEKQKKFALYSVRCYFIKAFKMMINQYVDLPSHFRSANYTTFTRRRNNFE